MSLKVRSTTRPIFSSLISVLICLCTFVFLSIPHIITLACMESSEIECPTKEGGEESEEELVNCCSSHNHSKERRDKGRSGPPEKSIQRKRIISSAEHISMIIGHHLANGLRAPLLI